MQDDDDSSIDSGAVSRRDWGRSNTAVPSLALAVFTTSVKGKSARSMPHMLRADFAQNNMAQSAH